VVAQAASAVPSLLASELVTFVSDHPDVMPSARATSFGAWADEYDRWRPTYPGVAVDWLVPPGATHVLEVGAGTGKLTDRLVERRLELDVVEPDVRMFELIRRRHPDVRVHEAGATDLPLGDASVDAVLVADAWHWFPQEDAAREAARVLRPGGWLGCLRYVPRPQHDWEWEALRLDPALQPPDDLDPLERLGLATGRAEQQVFDWVWMLTPEQWRGFVSTVSHVRLLPDDEREAVLGETERLVGRACDAAGTDAVGLHHDAVCSRWYPWP
jgi:SAM-dependent methyltransferase